ncbi:MAG: RNA polymerase sigma factor, partial [Candidatus Rokuibacteriota bacterium]
EQNRRWLVAYFIAATGDPSRAEDLCQDVFAAALKNAAQFDLSKSFGAWLRGIARNVLLMHYRQSRHRILSLDEAALDRLDRAAAHAEAAHAVPDYSELRLDVLRECLRSLPERGRAILGLKYSKNLASRQIGESVGMKATAVDVMISRARRMLQECVQRKMASVARG